MKERICKGCNHKMLEGFIPTAGLAWIPIWQSRNKMFFRGPKTEGFRLGRWRQFSMKEQPAWYCPECDIIVVDCKDIVD